MHLIKRSLKVLPLALVAASLMAPAPAMAADPVTAECAFTGLAGNLTPPVPGLPQTGGSGGFTFGGNATCTLTHGSTATTVSATINASGRYANIVCGTGTANGTATITFAANPTGTTSASATFSITFASGVGVLHISSFVDNQGHKGQGGGEVTIVPAQGSCTSSSGVSAFTVAGGFAVEGTH